MLDKNSFGNILRRLREEKQQKSGKRGLWSIANIAKRLGVSRTAYYAWEYDESLPDLENLKRIIALFRPNEKDIDALYRAIGHVPPEAMVIPFPPNPFFTGREDGLKQLEETLEQNGRVALTQPVSLSGLGGIGKTQLALAYAHSSFQRVYRTILWVNASSEAMLLADYGKLAQVLDLPEKDERDARVHVEAVKDWLETHTNWLLVMDNADDLLLARSFFPSANHGRILLTTRSQFAGDIGAKLIEVDKMISEDGLQFLLRRAHPDEPAITPETVAPDVRLAASQVVKLLDGHPLALDQAGAYLHERGGSFADYIALYAQKRQALLKRRRATHSAHDDHPESVVVTFQISFEQAAEQHPLATDILYFCAFLDPDAIPEELFQYDDQFKADPLALDEGIIALRRYSVLKIHIENEAFSMHHLVQAVLQDNMRDAMAPTKKRGWLQRVLRTVNAAFPDAEMSGTWPEVDWPQCQRLVTHGVQLSAFITTEQLISAEAGILLSKTAGYLWSRRQFQGVEKLYQQAVAIRRQLFGPEHPEVATSLNGLANLYYEQGRYGEAEAFYQQALQMKERLLGLEHPDLVPALNGLAKLLYYVTGNIPEAEALYHRAIHLSEQYLDRDHLYMGYLLMNLANLDTDQGHYREAESRYIRALHIWERRLVLQPHLQGEK